MSAFDEVFSDEAIDDLLAEFGERIMYLPAAGLPRQITAIVNRNPPEPLTGGEGLIVASLLITVKSDPGDPTHGGIEMDQLDTGGDLVEVALRAGGTPEARPIVRPANDDGATVFWVR